MWLELRAIIQCQRATIKKISYQVDKFNILSLRAQNDT